MHSLRQYEFIDKVNREQSDSLLKLKAIISEMDIMLHGFKISDL